MESSRLYKSLRVSLRVGRCVNFCYANVRSTMWLSEVALAHWHCTLALAPLAMGVPSSATTGGPPPRQLAKPALPCVRASHVAVHPIQNYVGNGNIAHRMSATHQTAGDYPAPWKCVRTAGAAASDRAMTCAMGTWMGTTSTGRMGTSTSSRLQ